MEPENIEGKKLIYQKMADVMKAVQPVTKDKTNKQQGYNFRGVEDVYAMIQPILAKHDIFLSVEIISTDREERPSKSGGVLITVQAKVKYRFVTIDGSFVSATVIGEGMDSGDKATNKAMSAAQKYLMIQTFCIPTGLSEDTEKDSPEPKPKSNLISTAQMKRLFAISGELKINNDDVKSILKKHGFESSKDITKDKYEAICKDIESWGQS